MSQVSDASAEYRGIGLGAISVGAFFLGGAVSALVFAIVFGWDAIQSLTYAMIFLSGLSLNASVVRQTIIAYQAGKKLVDCGPSSGEGWLLAGGAVYLLISANGFVSIASRISATGVISTYLQLSATVFFFATGFSRVSMCRNGILVDRNLVEWRKVKSYSWDPSPPSKLVLRVDAGAADVEYCDFSVDPARRSAVELLLAEKVPRSSGE